MKTQEFNQLENAVLDIMAQLRDARQTYYQEDWLSDAMYMQIFAEKVKELKKVIDDAIKESIL